MSMDTRGEGDWSETRKVFQKIRRMVKAGVPLREVVDSLREEYEAQGLAEVVEDVLDAAAEVGELMPRWKRRRSRRGRRHIKVVLQDDDGNEEVHEEVEDEREEPEEEPERSPRMAAQATGELLREALRANASDIHLEPGPEGAKVRLRVHGLLRDHAALTPSEAERLVARVKEMANLDVRETEMPQDGRILLRLAADEGGEPEDLQLRVAIGPTAFGEAVTVRLLRQRSMEEWLLKLDEILWDPEVRAEALKAATSSHGLVLVTGPTGCGKTTVLYGMVGAQDLEASKVISIEEPVELRIPGVHQITVRPAKGLTFPVATRHALRMDPDVLMLGEIRDEETAAILLRAALTGHMVLSQLHASDALSAITRLVDIGCEPYLLADVLRGIVGQRLVRRLCPECRVASAEETTRARDLYGDAFPADAEAYAPVGCEACEGRGYRGRGALQEMLSVTPELKRAIAQGADAEALAEAARSGGFRTMFDQSVAQVAAGRTSVSEILRVCPRPPGG